MFVHFLGTNSKYHVMRDVRGPSTSTMCRVVRHVAQALSKLKDEVIRWPENCQHLADQFFKLGGFPSTAGCLDGTHIRVMPPSDQQVDYLNRHHDFSINMLGVNGPDLSFYYINSNFGGRCHDAHVLQESSLWQSFEVQGRRPFKGTVCVGSIIG